MKRFFERTINFIGLATAGILLFLITGAPSGGGGSSGVTCASGQVAVGTTCTATPLLGVNNTTQGYLSMSMGAARNASTTIEAPYSAHNCPGQAGVSGGAADFEVDTPDNGGGGSFCIDNNSTIFYGGSMVGKDLTVNNGLVVNQGNNQQDLQVVRNGKLRESSLQGSPPTVGGTCGTSPVGPASPNGDQAFQFTTGTGSPTACTINLNLAAANVASMHYICQDRTAAALVVPTYTSASVITFPSLTASHVIECIGLFN